MSFPVAARVFADPNALMEQDRVVDGAVRWQTLGVIDGVALLVAHRVWDEDAGEVIGIISARKASRNERRRYEAGNG